MEVKELLHQNRALNARFKLHTNTKADKNLSLTQMRWNSLLSLQNSTLIINKESLVVELKIQEIEMLEI